MKHPRVSIPMVTPALILMLLAFLVGCGPSSSPKESQVSSEPREASPRVASVGVPSPIEFFPDRPGLPLLAANGKPLPIIVPAEAPPFTREAADFLAENIERIGGVRPEVMESLPAPLPEQAIWVGYQPAMDTLFPGVDFSFSHPEEIVLTANGSHLAITGRDVWDPEFPTLPGGRSPTELWQKESGTANATFTFLQDVVGVRWLYPGELGTDYPGPESLVIPAFSLRYHPQFRSRAGIFHQLDRGSKKGEAQDWVKHQRLLYHSLPMMGGHYFKDWWPKYGETRPELFALQPDGTRGTFPAATHHRKICEGEPLVWQTWLEEQSEQLANQPNNEILAAMPNDSYFQGHCTDPRSRAWDPDPSETDIRINLKWANGHSEEWPPLSDRYVTFANTLADMVKEKFPDKQLFVSTNAYGDVGRPKPIRTIPRDNVLIISVANFPMRDQAMREQHIQDFLNWTSIAKQVIWRPNLGNHAGRNWGMPDVPFQETMQDFRFVAEHGAIGVFFDMLFENWAPMAPYYYLVCQLGWNPYADGDKILDDYFQRCYGPAAKPMKEYWLLMEKTRNDLVHTVASRLSALMIPDFYTPEVLAMAESLLAEAKSLTQGSEKFTQRVEFTESGLIMAQRLVELRQAMIVFEGAKKDEREPAAEQVVQLWVALAEEVNAFPPHAINFKRIRTDPEKGGNNRVTGLHPSVPVRPSTLRRLLESGLDLE